MINNNLRNIQSNTYSPVFLIDLDSQKTCYKFRILSKGQEQYKNHYFM